MGPLDLPNEPTFPGVLRPFGVGVAPRQKQGVILVLIRPDAKEIKTYTQSNTIIVLSDFSASIFWAWCHTGAEVSGTLKAPLNVGSLGKPSFLIAISNSKGGFRPEIFENRFSRYRLTQKVHRVLRLQTLFPQNIIFVKKNTNIMIFSSITCMFK